MEAPKSPWAALASALTALVVAVPTMVSQLDLSGKVQEAVAQQAAGIENILGDMGEDMDDAFGGIDACHEDVAQLQWRVDMLTRRLERLESKAHVEPSIAEVTPPPPPKPEHRRRRKKGGFKLPDLGDPQVQQKLSEIKESW